MTKTKARTCLGCKAVCSAGCAFGFEVRKMRVGAGTDEKIFRFPVNPCFKAATNKKFLAVGEHLDKKAA